MKYLLLITTLFISAAALAETVNVPAPVTSTATITTQKGLKSAGVYYAETPPRVTLAEVECTTRSDTGEKVCRDTRMIQVQYSTGKVFSRVNPKTGVTGPSYTHDDLLEIIYSLFVSNQ